jgi:hypothetical protein
MLLSGGLFVGGVALIAWERVPAGGFLVVLVGSVAWLVPPQRRLIASGSPPPPADVEALRAQWLGGHLLRSAVALACFVLAVVATVV